MTHKNVAALLLMMDTAYNAKKADEGKIDLFYNMLKDLNFHPAKKAVEQLIATNEHYPKIAEIRRVYAELVHGKKRTGAEAWEILINNINMYSTSAVYERFKQDYPDVYKLAKGVGFRELLSGNESFTRAAFEKAYNTFADELQKENMLPAALQAETVKLRGGIYAQIEAAAE